MPVEVDAVLAHLTDREAEVADHPLLVVAKDAVVTANEVIVTTADDQAENKMEAKSDTQLPKGEKIE